MMKTRCQVVEFVQRTAPEQDSVRLDDLWMVTPLFGETSHSWSETKRHHGTKTANVDVRADRLVPANGIYATFTHLGPERYLSVTSIGVRPTFDSGERSIETYLLNFDRSLYGCDLVVEFVARLRPEKRFAAVQDLIAQIEQDVVDARAVLDAYAPAPDR